MDTFFRFFYEFAALFFGGVASIFSGVTNGFSQIFDLKRYQDVFNSYKELFTASEWTLVFIAMIFLVLIVLGIIVLLFFAVRKIIRFKRSKVDQEDLLEEISDLNQQVRNLMKEKENIMAMKVSQLGLSPEDSSVEEIDPETGENIDEKKDITKVRFPKLVALDETYTGFKAPIYHNDQTLEELVDAFRCFAATQLRLYYNPPLLRAFFGALACGKLIILQGISGTGKTSLAYAWGKFVKKDSCVASVEPSWRDKTEMLGYFNEFTKKFNETYVLAELYEAGFDDNVHTIILDEMNLARVEYYFAELLSILEMPSRDEWVIEIVSSSWPDDPKRIIGGNLKLPGNMWYIGTINNDDSTFMVTDKVYDRAMPLDINEKVEPFICREQEALDINASYLESLFKTALEQHPVSDENLKKVREMDNYVIESFRVAFGNRIMKQLNTFVPVYVACGGEEVEAIDYFIAKKILRKFEQLNALLIRDELDPFINYLNKTFGKDKMKECIAFIERMKKMG